MPSADSGSRARPARSPSAMLIAMCVGPLFFCTYLSVDCVPRSFPSVAQKSLISKSMLREPSRCSFRPNCITLGTQFSDRVRAPFPHSSLLTGFVLFGFFLCQARRCDGNASTWNGAFSIDRGPSAPGKITCPTASCTLDINSCEACLPRYHTTPLKGTRKTK